MITSQQTTQQLWFKRKRYGWGWTPVTWQGWLVVGIYVLLITLFALTLDQNSSSKEIAFMFVLPTLILSVLVIKICYKKGEKPKWQWGEDAELN